jgi:hypothetical protein
VTFTAALIVAGWWALLVLFAWAICAAAGRADRAIESRRRDGGAGS